VGVAAAAAGWGAAGVALVGVVAMGVAGLSTMSAVTEKSGGPLLRIVQPNVAQADKWRPENRERELGKLLDLSRRDGFDKLAAVILPETAVPFVLQPGSQVLPVLAQAAPPGGYLLAGAARAGQRLQDGVWNSMLVIDHAGTVVAYFDKVHLVPFGEYIPFHKELAPLTGLIGRGSF